MPRAMNCRASLVALTLFLIAMTPVATADLSRENQTLNLVCSNDDCSLSTDAAGDTNAHGFAIDADPDRAFLAIYDYNDAKAVTIT